MIYLIGGPPRCGKTTVARRLAATTGCSWVQTDWLEQAFAASVPPGEYAPVRLDPGPDVPRDSRNDVVYAKYSVEEIIAYYQAMAGRAWLGIRALVEYALFDEEDFIVEGYHVDPAPVREFLAADPDRARAVRAVFLIREDPDDILASMRRGDHKNDWVLGKTREEATFARIAAMIARYGAAVRIDAARAGLPVCRMDGDFERRVERAIELCVWDRAAHPSHPSW